MPSVSFEHVRKRFGDSTVVEDFDLEVADGELLVLVGGSGSGKSTDPPHGCRSRGSDVRDDPN